MFDRFWTRKSQFRKWLIIGREMNLLHGWARNEIEVH